MCLDLIGVEEYGAALLGDESVGALESEGEGLVHPCPDCVPYIHRVEEEDGLDVRRGHFRLKPVQPVLAQTPDIDPLLKVDYLSSDKVFLMKHFCLGSQGEPPLRYGRLWGPCDYIRAASYTRLRVRAQIKM